MLKADPEYRRRTLRLSVVILVLGLAVGVAVVQWGLPALARSVESRKPDDAIRLLKFLYAAVMISTTLPVAVYLFRLGLRIRRSDRWPPPGTRVTRDTPIIEGPTARRQAVVLMACSGVVLAAAVLGLFFASRL